VLAQQSSISSDLRLLFRLAVFERSHCTSQAAPVEGWTPAQQLLLQRMVAPMNVLITLLSKFFKIGTDLDEYV